MVSLLYAPQPLVFFFMAAAVSAVGPSGQNLTLFSVFWSASTFANWKRLTSCTLHEARLKQKIHTGFFFCSLSFCGVSPLKLNVLHTLLNNRDYFLSSVDLFTSPRRFDLMLIQLNNTRVCQVHLFELYTWSLDKQVLTHSRCIIVILKLKLTLWIMYFLLNDISSCNYITNLIWWVINKYLILCYIYIYISVVALMSLNEHESSAANDEITHLEYFPT